MIPFRPTNICWLENRKLWRARFVLPPDAVTGLKPNPLEATGIDKASATANLIKKMDAYNARRVATSDMTVADFIRDEFFPEQESRVRNPHVRFSWNTYTLRKSRLERFVVSYSSAFGKTQLKELKPKVVYRHFEDLRLNNACTGRVYNELRKDVLAVIRLILNRHGDDDQDIEPESFLRRVELLEENRKSKDCYTEDEILDAILDESLPLESRAWVAFIFIMCCRVEDVLALRWTDLDVDKGSVTFGHAVVRGEEGWKVVERTKTGRYDGEKLPLGTFLADLLGRVYMARKRAGKAYPWVFCRGDGKQVTLDSLYQDKGQFQVWQDIQADLKLRREPRYYPIKTTGNSYWLSNGVPVEVQLRKMRQSPKKLTLAQSVYRNISWDELVDAVTLRPRKQKQQSKAG